MNQPTPNNFAGRLLRPIVFLTLTLLVLGVVLLLARSLFAPPTPRDADGQVAEPLVPERTGLFPLTDRLAASMGRPVVLVAATNSHRVFCYDLDTGEPLDLPGLAVSETLRHPMGMALDRDGRLFVAGGSTGSVARFDGVLDGISRSLAVEDLEWANGMTLGRDDRLYVLGRTSRNVTRLDANGVSSVFLPTGEGDLSDPVDLLFEPDGNLLVSCVERGLLRFDGRNGSFVRVLRAQPGLHGLTRGPDGHVYASQGHGNVIVRHHGETGDLINVFARHDGIDLPYGLGFGPDGKLYVASHNNHQVFRFDGGSGAFLDAFVADGAGGLRGPTFLLFAYLIQ